MTTTHDHADQHYDDTGQQDTDEHDALEDIRPVSPALRCTEGALQGQLIEIDRELTLGRGMSGRRQSRR